VEFLPEYFHRFGYFTAGIGKVAHQSFADSISFDVMETTDDIGDADWGSLCADPSWCAPKIKDKKTLDGRIARHTAKLLREHQTNPFFIAVGFSKPHAPDFAPKKYFDLYDESEIPLPVPKDDSDGMTDQERRRARLAYYACVSFIDAQIGLLLDALDELNLRSSTVVVLTSDHGYLLGEHGIWNKHNLYEETARVPLIIAAPGRRIGTVEDIVELVDLFPTLAEICDLPVPGNLDGASMLALLESRDGGGKQYAFTESFESKNSPHERSVRDRRFTYIERVGDQLPLRLFDRLVDPEELTNLVGDPRYAGVCQRLHSALHQQ